MAAKISNETGKEIIILTTDQNVDDIDTSKWYLICFDAADFPKPLKFVSIRHQSLGNSGDSEIWQDEEGNAYEVLRKGGSRECPRELSKTEEATEAAAVIQEKELSPLRVPIAFLAKMLNTTISAAQRKFGVKGDMGLDELKSWLEAHSGNSNYHRWVDMIEKIEKKLTTEHAAKQP